MSDSVIDLGELRHGTDPEPLPRPPRANGRQLRCTLVLLLALVTLAASAVSPPRLAPVTLPTQPGADVLVDGDLVLVMEPTSPGRQGRLAAYRLPGGEPVWQAPLSAEARYWGMTPLAGMMLVTGYEIGPEGRETRTVALDRATGAYRWQQPGSVFELTDGNLLLRTGGETQPSGLRVVDPCCGTVRWQLPPPPPRSTFGTPGTEWTAWCSTRWTGRSRYATRSPARCWPAPTCARPTVARSEWT